MPREYGQLYPVAKAILTPLVRLFYRFEITGLERVPRSGGAIIAPNHISVIDSFFLPAVLPRRITYVGKAEYLDDWKTRHLFPAMGMIPIDRTGGSAAQAALDTAARVLADGELFGIYPEGTRSRSGNLHKGRTGVARLACRTGVPIVPVGIIGTAAVQPPDAPVPKPFMTVQINFGTPIEIDDETRANAGARTYREITDRLMYEISLLSGQTYVNTYAGTPSDDEEEAPGAGPLERRRSSAEVLGRAGAAA